MRRGPAPRAVNSINTRIAIICGVVAAAIMIGATLATRFSFPPLVNQSARPGSRVTVQPGVIAIAQSRPVDQFARARLKRSLVPKAVAQTTSTSPPVNSGTPSQPASATSPAVVNNPPPGLPAVPAVAPQPVQAPIPGRW